MYATTATAASLGAVVLVWFLFFNAPPTCFDGKQNGTEQGVDCGGGCALVCENLSSAPRVVWARAFQNGAPNIYTLAAYVQNTNPSAGAKQVPYIFQLYDAQNKLVAEKTGVVDMPPVQTVPIIVPSVDVGNRTVAHVEFSFASKTPLVWKRVTQEAIPDLRVARQQLAADGSRLDVTVENNSIFDAPKVTLVTILYDANDVARAASVSVVPVIAHKSSADAVFTWPAPNPNILRTEITILPSF